MSRKELFAEVRKHFPTQTLCGKGITNAYLRRMLATAMDQGSTVRRAFPTPVSEINMIILKYLDIQSLAAIAQSCRIGSGLVSRDNNELWSYHLKKIFTIDIASLDRTKAYNTYKKLRLTGERCPLIAAVKGDFGFLVMPLAEKFPEHIQHAFAAAIKGDNYPIVELLFPRINGTTLVELKNYGKIHYSLVYSTLSLVDIAACYIDSKYLNLFITKWQLLTSHITPQVARWATGRNDLCHNGEYNQSRLVFA